jgi:hypothetical protein
METKSIKLLCKMFSLATIHTASTVSSQSSPPGKQQQLVDRSGMRSKGGWEEADIFREASPFINL